MIPSCFPSLLSNWAGWNVPRNYYACRFTKRTRSASLCLLKNFNQSNRFLIKVTFIKHEQCECLHFLSICERQRNLGNLKVTWLCYWSNSKALVTRHLVSSIASQAGTRFLCWIFAQLLETKWLRNCFHPFSKKKSHFHLNPKISHAKQITHSTGQAHVKPEIKNQTCTIKPRHVILYVWFTVSNILFSVLLS